MVVLFVLHALLAGRPAASMDAFSYAVEVYLSPSMKAVSH
jgi:hypothetical protein